MIQASLALSSREPPWGFAGIPLHSGISIEHRSIIEINRYKTIEHLVHCFALLMAPFVAVGEYEKFAMRDDAYEGPIDLIVEAEHIQQVLS